MERKALIIGAGIGGAAAAIGLARAGWRVDVRERANDLEASGAALGIWPSAMSALAVLGVAQAVRDTATPQVSGSIRRPDGRRVATIDANRMRRRTGEPVHLISRKDLAHILSAAMPDQAVSFSTPGVLDDAARRSSDVVVVADGIFSAGRVAMFGPASAPRYTGNTAWRGAVPIAAAEVSETWAAGCRFGVTPYRDGLTNWYASIAMPPLRGRDDRDPERELALLRRTFGQWHDPIPRIVGALTESDLVRHDLYDLAPPLPSYVAGNAVLIGDAAHAMTPDLGRGACEALTDAVALAECLAGAVDIPTGLAAYDRQRRRPTQRLAALSYRMSRLAQARRFTGLRDLAVNVAFAIGP